MGVIPGPHLPHHPHPRICCTPWLSQICLLTLLVQGTVSSPTDYRKGFLSSLAFLLAFPNPLHGHTAAGMRGLQHKSSQACWVSAILDFAYKMLQEAPALASAPSPISLQGCSRLPCGQAEFLSGLLSVGVTCRTVPSAWNELPTHSQSPPLSLLPTGPPSQDPGRPSLIPRLGLVATPSGAVLT